MPGYGDRPALFRHGTRARRAAHQFCDADRLSTEARLRLFIQVCHAIQHAHQKGVIHRDIKPSNILVSVNDGLPVPKVIDSALPKRPKVALRIRRFSPRSSNSSGRGLYESGASRVDERGSRHPE